MIKTKEQLAEEFAKSMFPNADLEKHTTPGSEEDKYCISYNSFLSGFDIALSQGYARLSERRNGLGEKLKKAYEILDFERQKHQNELDEQFRLNGMGQERELALMSRLEKEQKRSAKLVAAIQKVHQIRSISMGGAVPETALSLPDVHFNQHRKITTITDDMLRILSEYERGDDENS